MLVATCAELVILKGKQRPWLKLLLMVSSY
ncbi:unnamed protein product [Timema podura]|uniref:Uncharacterized protein n=1 Tax=Timema podura TaxID=61482 RepID=A0ABN7PF88_TIMPD|nr:unnamed protein product [Timema podura]